MTLLKRQSNFSPIYINIISHLSRLCDHRFSWQKMIMFLWCSKVLQFVNYVSILTLYKTSFAEQCFKVLENSNGVHGLIASPETQDPPNTFFFGNTNGDSAACRELCLREPLCLVYVQHLADFAEPEWAGQCYGRSGFSDTMVGETGVESGTRGGCGKWDKIGLILLMQMFWMLAP